MPLHIVDGNRPQTHGETTKVLRESVQVRHDFDKTALLTYAAEMVPFYTGVLHFIERHFKEMETLSDASFYT